MSAVRHLRPVEHACINPVSEVFDSMLGQTLLLIWLAVILQPSLNDAFRDFFPIETAIKPAGFTRNDAGDAGNGKVTA